MKSDELLLSAATWVSLLSIMLSERTQTQEATSRRSLFIWNTQKGHIYRDKLDERMPGPAGPIGDWLLMGTQTLFVALAVFHDCTVVVVVAPLCEVPKRHCTGCIEWVWFVVCNYTSVKQFRKVMQMPRRDMWEKMCHCFCNNEECPCSFHVLGPASSTCARCSLQRQSLCTSGQNPQWAHTTSVSLCLGTGAHCVTTSQWLWTGSQDPPCIWNSTLAVFPFFSNHIDPASISPVMDLSPYLQPLVTGMPVASCEAPCLSSAPHEGCSAEQQPRQWNSIHLPSAAGTEVCSLPSICLSVSYQRGTWGHDTPLSHWSCSKYGCE